jgi:hypothetical protein
MTMGIDQSPQRTEAHEGGGGASGVADVARAASFATRLAEFGGLSVADATAEFTRLLASDGLSLYLQIAAAAPGATLTIRREDVTRAMLCVPGAFCCATGQPSAEPSPKAFVMVLWSRSATHREFEATCPVSARRVSLVINGRLLNVTPEGLPLTYDLVTA